MIKRLLIWVLLGAGFFVSIQYIPAYFYASEFDDFVKDEVKFAPTRESTDVDHLSEHITEMSTHYGVQIDTKGIVVKKTAGSNYQTLSVSVTYSMPVDLYYLTHQLHRQVNATISY